jgi:pimeloyl-ACP methyl ester carboxylesterase
MATADVNGIAVEYEERGDPDGRPLLLIHGLGAQLTAWRSDFCDRLGAQGFRLIIFDNRDVGLSTWFDEAGLPDMLTLFGGGEAYVPYLLDDMADDATGLLDWLGIGAAHVMGVSLGGMIAQATVIRHPTRVLSLCSIMSTPDARSVGQPKPEALQVLLQPPVTGRDEVIEASVVAERFISSPGYTFDEECVRDRAGAAYDRAFHPDGAARQLAAAIASPDRRGPLGSVVVPTVVIHGTEDPLIQLDGGEATAKAIPGSKLVLIDGMAHDLPVELYDRVISAIRSNADEADEGDEADERRGPGARGGAGA